MDILCIMKFDRNLALIEDNEFLETIILLERRILFNFIHVLESFLLNDKFSDVFL